MAILDRNNSRNVTVKKSELLSKLKDNRAKHEAEYNLAVEEYKKVAKLDIEAKKKTLVKQLAELSKKLDTDPVGLHINETLSFDIHPPISHVEDYDDVIALFESEVSDNVVLTSIEYSQFYLAKWPFANELKNSRVFYAVKQASFS